MSGQNFPPGHPISSLPLLATMIDGLLESAQENHLDLKAARYRPHMLDDYAVNRLIRTFAEQQEELRFYDVQLARWGNDDLDPDQRHEVGRLTSQLRRLREMLGAILSLAAELKAGIEKTLGRSKIEMALDLLSAESRF